MRSPELTTSPDVDGSVQPTPGSSQGEGSIQPSKKRKIERARTACMPCRSRKCKCGGSPPQPCPNCIDDNIPCQWPTEDGRSSQARKDRSRARRLQSLAERGLGRPPSKAQATDRIGLGSDVSSTPWEVDVDSLPTVGPDSTHFGMHLLGDANVEVPAFRSEMVDMLPFNPPMSAGETGTSPLSFTYPDLDFTLPDLRGVNFDPEQFILAMTSQLPTVEVGSATDETSPSSQLAVPSVSKGRRRADDNSRVVKITWWRPHGPTAIAPGLKRLSLRVRIPPCEPRISQSPGTLAVLTGGVPSDSEMFGPDNMPVAPVMRHLLDIFADRFGCQFPFLEQASLLDDLDAGSGSVFLFNCVAATAARFSTHPVIAREGLQPHEYGEIFAQRAKSLLPSMLAVPSRETVMALILLAHIGFGNDSESEEWMFTGMAVRMAIDLGLHLDPGDESDISAEDRRLNRLTFWPVLLLDYALSFGTGRQTTFRIEEITTKPPSDEDMQPLGTPSPGLLRSPFPFAARQMLSYGKLINLLNAPHKDPADVEKEIHESRSAAVALYSNLPPDMQWSVQKWVSSWGSWADGSLQLHKEARQGPIFLHIHLWMHTIIASAYLTGTEYGRRHPRSVAAAVSSGCSTPVTAANVSRNSARTIGDILVLSDVIDDGAYLALPFINQAFYVAGCCYIKEIEQHGEAAGEPSQSTTPSADAGSTGREAKQADLFRSMLTSVATTSISTLQRGLARQTNYWAGVAWVASTLGQRLEGIHPDKVDLAKIQEALKTYVSMPDAGLLSARQHSEAGGSTSYDPAAASVPFDFGEFLERFLPT